MAVTVSPGKRSYNVVWNIGKIKSSASNAFYLENSKWCFLFETDLTTQKEEDWKMYLKRIHPSHGNHTFSVSVYAEDRFRQLECLSFTKLNVQKSGMQQIMWRRKSNVLQRFPYLKLDSDASLVITILSDHRCITDVENCTDNKLTQTSSYKEVQPCLESLSKDLNKLREGESEADFEIRCGDITLQVHRAILIARSEVFAAMLQSEMLEKNSRFVEIGDIKYPTLDSFLKYLYTGTFPNIDVDACIELYEAADKYGVEALKTQCALFLKENLTVENACNMLVLADTHCDEILKDYVTSYMIRKDILLFMEGGQPFCSLHPKLAVDVLYQAYRIMKVTLSSGTK